MVSSLKQHRQGSMVSKDMDDKYGMSATTHTHQRAAVEETRQPEDEAKFEDSSLLLCGFFDYDAIATILCPTTASKDSDDVIIMPQLDKLELARREMEDSDDDCVVQQCAKEEKSQGRDSVVEEEKQHVVQQASPVSDTTTNISPLTKQRSAFAQLRPPSFRKPSFRRSGSSMLEQQHRASILPDEEEPALVHEWDYDESQHPQPFVVGDPVHDYYDDELEAQILQTRLLDFSELCRNAFDIFSNQLSIDEIAMKRIPTYQGRLEGSINGCTLIASLLCIHFFQCNQLTASKICQVIDEETPVLLSQIRTSLQASKDSLLIPADVAEYLLDNKHWQSKNFVEVLGGNILDAAHVDNLITSLFEGTKKRAATLFFQEHVVALLRNGQSVELIDSLPNTEFLNLELQHSFNAVRVSCAGRSSLANMVRWYACSKLSCLIEIVRFIEYHPWKESNADSDPRVFQAFVWEQI